MVRRFIAKAAATVTESAVGRVHVQQSPGGPVESLKAVEQAVEFASVGADVLHRRGADAARNQRQVFQAVQMVRKCPVHQRVPVLGRRGAHQRTVIILFDDVDAAMLGAQHHGIGVASEQHVAAFSQQQQRPLADTRVIEQIGHGVGTVQTCQQRRTDGHSKRIGGTQVGVGLQREARLGHAARSMPRKASTHSPIRAGPR
jgi:hypothetical protein